MKKYSSLGIAAILTGMIVGPAAFAETIMVTNPNPPVSPPPPVKYEEPQKKVYFETKFQAGVSSNFLVIGGVSHEVKSQTPSKVGGGFFQTANHENSMKIAATASSTDAKKGDAGLLNAHFELGTSGTSQFSKPDAGRIYLKARADRNLAVGRAWGVSAATGVDLPLVDDRDKSGGVQIRMNLIEFEGGAMRVGEKSAGFVAVKTGVKAEVCLNFDDVPSDRICLDGAIATRLGLHGTKAGEPARFTEGTAAATLKYNHKVNFETMGTRPEVSIGVSAAQLGYKDDHGKMYNDTQYTGFMGVGAF